MSQKPPVNNFEWIKDTSHKSVFIVTVDLFPSIALLLLFFICNFTAFFSSSFPYKSNEYEYMRSFISSAFFCI